MSLEITGEIVKSAIAKKIIAGFTSKEVKPVVYKEQIKQGFKYPSFFIWEISKTQKKRMNLVYDRDYLMEIRYALEEDDTKAYEKLEEVGNKLMLLLDTIDIPIRIAKDETGNIEGVRMVRAKGNIETKKDENVLIVTVTYPITIKYVSNGIKMKSLNYDEEII